MSICTNKLSRRQLCKFSKSKEVLTLDMPNSNTPIINNQFPINIKTTQPRKFKLALMCQSYVAGVARKYNNCTLQIPSLVQPIFMVNFN